MATLLRNPSANERAIAHAFNQVRHLAGSSSVHADAAELSVTVADCTSGDLDSMIALAKNLHDVYSTHIADTLAHAAADSTNAIGVTKASIVSQATAITFANALKAAYNAHRSQSGVHHADDSGNATTATNASNASTLATLLNEMKADINAHLATALAGSSLRVVGF